MKPCRQDRIVDDWMNASRTPVVVTGVLTALVGVFLSNSHLCHLQSVVAEVPLLVLTPVLCCHWTARARTAGGAWWRTIAAVIFTVLLQMAYLTWLHSDYFPDVLLSPRAKESIERHQELLETMRKGEVE